MASKITYKYKNVAKEISFAYDKFHNMHEAVAAEEGIDLTHYLKMVQAIEMTSKGSAAVRNYRDAEFIKMGFSDLYFIKGDPKAE